MKLGMSVFQNRIAPVFDWSGQLLLVEVEGEHESRRELRKLDERSSLTRVDRLAEMEIELLICGGISAPMHHLLKNRRIRVIPWVAGEVEQVLKAFLKGELPGERFVMPGCCGNRGRRMDAPQQACKGKKRPRRGRGPRGPAR